MSKFNSMFPFVYQLFMKIAEPRVVRLIHFGIYVCMIIAGFSVVFSPPTSFQAVLGYGLVHVLGGFIFAGSLLGAFAVLPGLWWLERIGIILLVTGLAMYIVIISSLNGSAAAFAIAFGFILTFIQRWLEIRRYQLAPREE